MTRKEKKEMRELRSKPLGNETLGIKLCHVCHHIVD